MFAEKLTIENADLQGLPAQQRRGWGETLVCLRHYTAAVVLTPATTINSG